jgi:acetyl-CoA decarbonylase/synthase complex subunit gamma
MIASVLIAKYAGIIILSDLQGDVLFPLFLERLNIFTDPQRPMVVKEDIYPINGPDENSPVLITCNFSLTYFIVSGEVEGSKVPSWLLIKDTEGLSVLTAWAAGKFGADLIAQFIKKNGIEDKVKHRELIIPGYLATIKGELEEELPDWTITIGPREAGHMPAFLKEWKPEA